MTFITHVGRLSDQFTSHLIGYKGRMTGAADVVKADVGIIRRAQMQAVLSITTTMMVANVVNAGALVLIKSEMGSLHFSTAAWATVVVFFAIQGFRSARRVVLSPLRATSSERAPGKIVISSFLLAVIWSYPVLFLLNGSSAAEFAFICAMTAGMIAGGALSLYPLPLAAVSYTTVLSTAALCVVLNGTTGHVLPFFSVTIAFSVIVMIAIHRHTGIFFLELAAKIEAERQRDMTNLLLDTYHGEGGQYLWRTTPTFDLITDPTPLLGIIDVDIPKENNANLFDLLGKAGFFLPDWDRNVPVLTKATLSALGGTGITIRVGDRVLKVAGRAYSDTQPHTSGYLGYVKDISAEVLAAEERERLATQDSWTELLNYRELLQRGELMRNTAAPKACHLFLFIDADDLKTVNDHYGHAAGDQLILVISRKLIETLPEGALIARKGGDEFLALMPCDNASHGETIALEVMNVLRSSFQVSKSNIAYSCCVGASVSKGPLPSLARLELEADRALYKAKSTGKRRMRIYDAEMGAEIGRSRRLAMDLLAAIETESLEVYYQPIVSGPTGVINGAEALLRWTHPEFGAIPPLEILAIARENGVSAKITSLVLRKAAAVASGWPQDTFVSVNMNASDLKTSRLADSIVALVKDEGLMPNRLWLELTESEALVDCDVVRANISDLRTEGVVMAIDDFGAGYSSLSTFDRHDFDIIKIDRSLVAQCKTSANSRIFLQSIRDLANVNGCRVVAEGVETEEELEAIRAIGFEFTQGFYFARPMQANLISQRF